MVLLLFERRVMKVISLSMKGVELAKPVLATHDALGEYFRFEHGETGRGRKLVFIPLNIKDFPVNKDYNWEDMNFSIQRRNNFYILNKGGEGIINDNTFLILWSLSPGYRGSAEYTIGENCELIYEGREAQGDAGRMGGAPCPVVLVKGPTMLRWTRIGRIYNTPPHWVAKFDGANWIVRPDDPAEEALELMLKGQL